MMSVRMEEEDEMKRGNKHMKYQHSSLTTHYSLLCTRLSLRARGTAAVETALVMPLYALILFGMIYFGYATITRTRQTVAASGAAWLPGTQTDDDLTGEFWRYVGNALQDTTVETEEDIALDDVYYGNEIDTQLVAGIGSLGGSGAHTFDEERIAASLWTLALGEVTQRFDFVPGQGLVERMHVHYDDYAIYLNSNARGSTGFISTDESPVIGDEQRWIAESFDGFGTGRWIERRRVHLEADYRPPFFRQVVRDPDAPPTNLATFVSGDYPEPDAETRIGVTFDLTGRGEATRLAADEVGGEDMVADVTDFLDTNLSEANELDAQIQSVFQRNPWIPQ